MEIQILKKIQDDMETWFLVEVHTDFKVRGYC